jgi:IS4 transposase
MLEEDAYVIASIYKQRWEIEVFFKFIKQHLNVTHLVSREKNGIEVMLYMTMIAAILILAFKKLNKIGVARHRTPKYF